MTTERDLMIRNAASSIAPIAGVTDGQIKKYLLTLPKEKSAVSKTEPFCHSRDLVAKCGLAISNHILNDRKQSVYQLVWADYRPNQVALTFYIKPGIYFSSINQRNYSLPIPHRYITMRIAQDYYNPRCLTYFFERIYYTAHKLNERSNWNRDFIGCFLPNASITSLCLNHTELVDIPSVETMITAFESMLSKYFYSNYNNDWLCNIAATKSFYFMAKRFEWLPFGPKVPKSWHDNIFRQDHYSYYDSHEVRNSWTMGSPSPNPLYHHLLEQLQDHPNFWKTIDYEKEAAYPFGGSGNYHYVEPLYKDFIYDTREMKSQIRRLFPYKLNQKV